MINLLAKFKFSLRLAVFLILFSLCLAVALGSAKDTHHPVSHLGLQSATQTNTPVFVHLFEWQWEDVAQECEAFLAPSGYGAVQLSPAAEHVVVPEKGFPWWQRYQPVSYRIESRSGSRSEFAAMVQRCHAVGIKLYADAVINHMAALTQGVGNAGSSFTKYNYPGLYQPPDFHSCKKAIADYQNRQEVTECELVGLADLKTKSNKVQQQIADYLIDLVHLGIDGFRIDAAKHISSKDVAAILQKVNAAVDPDPYIYQEVIDPGNEVIRKSEYYTNGKVIEFEYGRSVGESFLGIDGQTLAQLETLGESWGLMPSEKAIVFIDNHDKQRGHGGGGHYLTYKNGRLYDLATLFMLAFPYGRPQVMSSYAFESESQGPPADPKGQTNRIYSNGQALCGEDWICEHRHPIVAAMVNFRNQIPPDAPLTHWWSNGNQIAFGRGSSGFVVINRSDEPLSHTFQTDLTAGIYCNITAGRLAADGKSCTGEAIAVDRQGHIHVQVDKLGAIAIHLSEKLQQ
ncbi:alpha-amylase family protein [Phormidium tenue FACHB-886]|nr:alpha-amylase family protein [Phormidium tenue FACHB-886]